MNTGSPRFLISCIPLFDGRLRPYLDVLTFRKTKIFLPFNAYSEVLTEIRSLTQLGAALLN